MATVVNFQLANSGKDLPDRPAQPLIEREEFLDLAYPSHLSQNSGQVIVLTLLIEPSGMSEVLEVKPAGLSGDYLELVRQILAQWKFQPAESGGQPVACLLEVSIKLEPR